MIFLSFHVKVFEFVGGGELFSYLRKVKRFDSPTANFYAREILLALDYLHSLNIIYRYKLKIYEVII